MLRASLLAAGAALLIAHPISQAHASDGVVVPMTLVSSKGAGAGIGTVTLRDGPSGLVLKLDLTEDLAPGPHGFHLHENGSCAPAEKDGAMVAALGAGGHYDPAGTGMHRGPAGGGHKGDLPILQVSIDEDGSLPVKHGLVAPQLTLADALGRSLVIHALGDNFRDEPAPLGGGGARVACGVVPTQ
mgnify:CR=1 FL=1